MYFRTLLKTSVLFGKLLNFFNINFRPICPVISMIFPTSLYWKCYVSEIVAISLIRMTSHHCSTSEKISHHWSHMVDSISSCTITGNKDFICVNHVHNAETLDNKGYKLRYVPFPPHVWGLFRRTRHKPYRSRWKVSVIKMFMIVPLLLVNLKWAISSAMESKYKSVTWRRSFTVNKVLKSHFVSFILNEVIFQDGLDLFDSVLLDWREYILTVLLLSIHLIDCYIRKC